MAGRNAGRTSRRVTERSEGNGSPVDRTARPARIGGALRSENRRAERMRTNEGEDGNADPTSAHHEMRTRSTSRTRVPPAFGPERVSASHLSRNCPQSAHSTMRLSRRSMSATRSARPQKPQFTSMMSSSMRSAHASGAPRLAAGLRPNGGLPVRGVQNLQSVAASADAEFAARLRGAQCASAGGLAAVVIPFRG
jgi:hypothetical protein